MSVFRWCARWMIAVGLVLPLATHAASSDSKLTRKLIVYPEAGETVTQLKAAGISKVDNYGSYWVVETDEAHAAELRRSHGDRVMRADHLNQIGLKNAHIDTSIGEPVVAPHLRQAETSGKQLRLVQFKGPIQPSWLDQIKKAGGARLVSYVPNNAYIVWLDKKAEKLLRGLMVPAGPIQWMGAYHGGYKVPSALLESSQSALDVRVAVVDGPDSAQTIQALSLYAQGVPGKPSASLNQLVVKMRVEPSGLASIAQLPDVLWLEEALPLRKYDEEQGLIMASRVSQLPGHSPVPGVDNYLDFLTNTCGFSTNAEEYPVLNIQDTLATSEILFNDFYEGGSPSNSTRLTGFLEFCPPASACDDFHGVFVASVAAGYNSSTSDPINLDAQGFRKGMGVSPFGRISNTMIFSIQGGQCLVCDNNFDFIDLPINEYLVWGARISNNSWGGGVLGGYDAVSQVFDLTVRDAVLTGGDIIGSNVVVTPGPFPLNQEMITIFSAGNDQGLGSGNGGFGDVLVTPPATAKNVISVGASEAYRTTDSSECELYPSRDDNTFDISFYSSYGPTLDGRFKPEIVAPGSAIFGVDSLGLILTNAFTGNAYICGNGTSFSAPAVSGAIQLLWWWFERRLQNEQGQNLLQPSPAMAKAYLCNSARYLPITNPQTGAPDTLPSIAQGMGIIDLARMFDTVPRVIRDESTWRALDTPLVTSNPAPQQTYFSQSGQSYEVSGKVADSTLPFRATLAWVDAPGNPAAFQQLVNDLDLEVRVSGKTYKGNVFSGQNSVTGGAADSVNNMESVFLPAGQTGTWSVVVRATDIAGDGVGNVKGNAVGQDFALVVYNAAPGNSTDVPNLSTNNSCQNAISINKFPFAFTNTLSKALYNNVHPSPTAARGGIDEFFKIVLPTAGAQFTINTFGSKFDTVLSVWRVQVVPQNVFVTSPCGALVELVSNNDSGGNQSQVSFVADGSNTYYVVVETHNDGAGGQMILNVQAVGLPISISPSTVNFGSQIVGTTSAVQTVTLSNNSTIPLNVNSVTIEGANAADFFIAAQDCDGNVIPAGSNCTISVQFAPTSTGPRVAELVTTDDLIGSPRIVLLNGQGLPPAPLICASTNSIDFGSVSIGTTSPVQSVTITNCGTLPLNVSSVTVTGPDAGQFFISTDTCSGQTIPIGGVCSFDVRFAPTNTGGATASIEIVNDSPFSPQIISLSASGKGSQPDALISKRRNRKGFIGAGVISTNGAGEQITLSVRRGKTKVFYVACQNNGNASDIFTVLGTGNVAQGISVKYFLGAYPKEAIEITGAVLSGEYETATMEASAVTGAATMFRVEVTADENAVAGSYSTLVTLKSTSAPSKSDTVKATVNVR